MQAQGRIFIDFDASDDERATAGPPASPRPASADAAAGAGSTAASAADMQRSIQSMRLSLQRLEQERPAAVAPGGAVADKQAALKAEVSSPACVRARPFPSLARILRLVCRCARSVQLHMQRSAGCLKNA